MGGGVVGRERPTHPPAYQLNDRLYQFHILNYILPFITMPKLYAKLKNHIQKALHCLNYQEEPNIAAAAREFRCFKQRLSGC